MSNLAVKIAKASLIVGGKLTPDKRNMQDRYEYVSADQILSAGGQALAEAGVACLPSVTSAEVLAFDRGGGKNRYDAKVQFVFILADDESTMELVWVGYGSDYTVPDKAIYKAITSGHRYFLAKLLNIGAGNEDGEHESGDERKGGTTGTVAGSVNNGNGPCPSCFAPVGKIHLPRCTATNDPQMKGQTTQKNTEPASNIDNLNDVEELDFNSPFSSATQEFLAIPSQEPGMTNGKPSAQMGDKTRKHFHAVGVKLYGDEWEDKRYELVTTITKGTAKSSNELTEQQAKTLISGMEKKLNAVVRKASEINDIPV